MLVADVGSAEVGAAVDHRDLDGGRRAEGVVRDFGHVRRVPLPFPCDPGQKSLLQGGLVDGQRAAQDRPLPDCARRLDDRAVESRQAADDPDTGPLEGGELSRRAVGDDSPRGGAGCRGCARRGDAGESGRRTERPGESAHTWRYRAASLERAPWNEGRVGAYWPPQVVWLR